MYVEKDSTGHIIIQGLTPDDAEMLDDCLCCYLAGDPIGGGAQADRVETATAKAVLIWRT